MSSVLRVHTQAVQNFEGFSLEPLYFAIRFNASGNSLPLHNVPDYLPLKVSVHIPDEFLGQFTCSLIDLKSWNPPLEPQNYLPVQDRPERYPVTVPVTPAAFPFFPLSHTFDPYEGNSWQMLASQIEAHLMRVTVENEDHNYMVAREFFWMAFIAAFPFFPSGRWPAWNPRINLSGDFIAYWITDHVAGATTLDGMRKAREFIWDEFQNLAVYLLPFPISVSSD